LRNEQGTGNRSGKAAEKRTEKEIPLKLFTARLRDLPLIRG